MGIQLYDDTAHRLAHVDEFWFGPSNSGGLVAAEPTTGRSLSGLTTRPSLSGLGPSLSGLKVSGRRSRSRLVAALAAGLVVVLVAAVFVMNMSGGAKGQVFRYALAKGHKQVYDLSISLNGVAAGVPDAPPLKGTLGATLGYEVVSKEADGSQVVEFTLENLRSDPPGAFGAGMPAGSTLRVKIAPNGSVSDVEGVGGVFGAVGSSMNSFSSLPGSPSDTAGSQFMFPLYPAAKIAPGDGWNEESTVPLPFGDNTVTVKATGKHNGFTDDPQFGEVAKFHHAISAPMDVKFSVADVFKAMGDAGTVPPEAASAVMKITGDMSMDADSLVVPATSELLRLDGTAKMAMRMVVEGLPDSAGAPDDLAFDLTMKITLLRVDGAAAKNVSAESADAQSADVAATSAEQAPAAERSDKDPITGEELPGRDPVPGGYGDDVPAGEQAPDDEPVPASSDEMPVEGILQGG